MLIKYITYILLLLSVISLWFPTNTEYKIKEWQIFVMLALIVGYFAKIVNLIAVLEIMAFYVIVYMYHKKVVKGLRYNGFKTQLQTAILWFIVAELSIQFADHMMQGFNNLLVITPIKFTADAVPFRMYLNFDKTMVGVIILGLTLPRNANSNEWISTFKAVVKFMPIVIIVLFGLAYSFSYIKFEPKIVSQLGIWIIDNLFFVCMAEEVIFRGFIQHNLAKLKYKYAGKVAIIIAALLFGLLHYHGGVKYVIFATVAGILYGYIYYKTKKIEASILTHFLLNLTHILLFTYPALMAIS